MMHYYISINRPFFILFYHFLSIVGDFSTTKISLNHIMHWCPMDEVPFLNSTTDEAYFCSPTVHCPAGYNCFQDKICCGKPGQCPNGQLIATDNYGHLLACLPHRSVCPSYSICLQSTSSDADLQFLCCNVSEPTTPRLGSIINAKRSNDPLKYQFSSPGSSYSSNNNDIACPLNNNHYSQRIFRCQLTESHHMTPLLCANKESSAEMLPIGVVRKCTPQNPLCSTGYSCEPSTRTGTMLCCSFTTTILPYKCPSIKQIPAISGNNNMYCTKPGQSYVCPAGAICQTAANTLNIHICCYEKHKITQPVINYPKCPNDGIAQSGTGNGFVPCSQVGARGNECAEGNICAQAINIPNQNLCCTVESTLEAVQPICPQNRMLLMSDNTPYYCFPTESVHCPDNYACSQAVNHFGTYVCCSELSATIPHSINLTPALDENGDKIYCTPNNPLTCPANTICIKSANSPDEYFCCDSSSSHKICPDNQVASVLPNGQLEVCIGAGASCSQIGYTCQISLELFTWVCCGYSTAMAVCLDGRETFYETEGQTYACDPTTYPTNCPVNYKCARSNQPGISVCCLKSRITRTTSFTSTLSVLSRRKSKARTKTTPKSSNTVATTATTTMITSTLGTTVKPECPFAWHPYVAYQTGDNQFCSSITDKSCPSGYSCTHSTHHGIYMCCRFGSGLQCATGTNILLVNNRPRLCTVTGANICPVGYSCQISTLENIYICCGDIQIEDERTIIRPFGNHIRCKNDLSIPALIYNHYIRFCSTVGSYNECPNGYICSNSNQTNVNVCCRTVLSGLLIIKVEPEEAFCGENAFPYHENGNPLECSDDKDNICPENYVCQPSFTNTKMYCCLAELQCPSGVIPNFPKYCQHLDDCQLDEECEEAKNMNGIHICCPKTIQNRTRCLGRETFLTDAVPVSCSSTTNCPDDYECSNLTTTNDYACCMKESKLMQICPDNRDPYRKFMDDGPLYCDKNDFTCPKGYLCKQSLLNGRFICCSPIGFCQLGKLPQLDSDTNQAKRCFTEFDDNSTYSNACKEGFTCQQSTVKYLRVCCDSSNNTANHHFNVKSKS